MSRGRLIVFLILLVTIALGGAAIFIGMRLGQDQDISPGESGAASQEVWDASLVKTAQERETFAKKWADLEAASGYTFEKAKAFALGEGARFRSDAPILKVETETLYGRDLNYYLFFHAYNAYTSAVALTDADVDPIIDRMISDSLILQKAEELGLATLGEDVFNALEKNYTKRNRLITNHSDRVLEEFVEVIEGEAIFIWYRNSVIPADVETGREVAQRKINELYTRLNAGEITMWEAAEIIKNDNEIKTKADPTAEGNAYYEFRTQRGEIIPAFDDPDLESQLWALGQGQMSKVLVGKLPWTREELEASDVEVPENYESIRDLYFCIIKVNKRSSGTKYKSDEEFQVNEPSASVSSGESEILLK